MKYLIFVAIFICSSIYSKDVLDVIYIDAGHGGRDPGTMNIMVKEKDINLPIALKLGSMIQNAFPNTKIYYSRTKDDFTDPKERAAQANQLKAKLYIAIHANHKKEYETVKNGFEIYILNKDRLNEAVEITLRENTNLVFQQYGNDETDKYIFSSLAQYGYLKYTEYLASSVQINMIDMNTLFSRGVMQAGYWVLLGASMPSILVECGYISDENDVKILTSDQGQTSIANALFEGYKSYKILYEMQ
ncbi:MAG: N-acetylmuramoyl-L-alanine amidase [Ignavibacteriae bacterium]|nr:MAG: N-acetylmuramoyl-L-alanine amidase [Ignavibacteriota bacterium]